MPNILGELKKACLEILASDPTGPTTGRIWFNSTEEKIKYDTGTGVKTLRSLEDPLIVGTSGTSSENVLLRRSAAGVLQLSLGNDVTAEGSFSTSFATLAALLEKYTDAGKPAFGNQGRLIYVTDLNQLQVDTGSAWFNLGGGVDDGLNIGGFAELFESRVANDLRFRTLQSSDSSIGITQNADNVDLIGPKFLSQTWVVTQPTFQVKAATTANGNIATAFSAGQTIDGVVLATNDIILVKNQSTPSENGVYVVQAVGVPTRHVDYDTVAELNAAGEYGAGVYVQQGYVNALTSWFQTALLSFMSDGQVWAISPKPVAWVVPATVTSLGIVACGGGGGGGAGGYSTESNNFGADEGGGGGGGGQGALPIVMLQPVTPGETLYLSVGNGGYGGQVIVPAAGQSGANSVVTGTGFQLTSLGGVGGAAGANGGIGIGNGGAGGAGGSAASTYVGALVVNGGAGGKGGSFEGENNVAGSNGQRTIFATWGLGNTTISNGRGGGGGGGGAGFGIGGNGGAGGPASANPNTTYGGVGTNGGLAAGGGGGGGAGTNNGGYPVGSRYYGGKGGFGGSGFIQLYWVE